MIFTKSVQLPHPFGRMDLFVVEELLKQTADEEVTRRNLYIADPAAPGGMQLIKRGDLYRWTPTTGDMPVLVTDAEAAGS